MNKYIEIHTRYFKIEKHVLFENEREVVTKLNYNVQFH